MRISRKSGRVCKSAAFLCNFVSHLINVPINLSLIPYQSVPQHFLVKNDSRPIRGHNIQPSYGLHNLVVRNSGGSPRVHSIESTMP